MRARLCDLATERSFRSRKRTWESGGGGSSRWVCRRSGLCPRRAEAAGRSIPSPGWPMKVRTLLGCPPPCNAAGYLRHTLLAELPQPEEAGAVPLRRDFEEPRNVAESLVIDERPERDRPDLALADVLVAVDAGSERLHRIVEVEGADGLESEHGVESFESGLEAALVPDVVAGRKGVAGVQAYRNPVGATAQVADRAQFLESAPQARSLAGGGLEQDLAAALVGGEDAIQGVRHVAHPLLRVGVRAGMHHQGRDAQEIGAGKLVGEAGDGLLPQVAGASGEIDEVTRVHRARQRGFRVPGAEDLRI